AWPFGGRAWRTRPARFRIKIAPRWEGLRGGAARGAGGAAAGAPFTVRGHEGRLAAGGQGHRDGWRRRELGREREAAPKLPRARPGFTGRRHRAPREEGEGPPRGRGPAPRSSGGR